MLFALAAVLLIAWFLGFVVFHVAHFAIHILLILAFVSVLLSLFRSAGRRRLA